MTQGYATARHWLLLAGITVVAAIVAVFAVMMMADAEEEFPNATASASASVSADAPQTSPASPAISPEPSDSTGMTSLVPTDVPPTEASEDVAVAGEPTIGYIFNYALPVTFNDGATGYKIYLSTRGFSGDISFEVQYQSPEGEWLPLDIREVQGPFDDTSSGLGITFVIYTSDGAGAARAPFQVRAVDSTTSLPTEWLSFIPPLPSDGWELPIIVDASLNEDGSVTFAWQSNEQMDLYNQAVQVRAEGVNFPPYDNYCATWTVTGGCTGSPLSPGSYDFYLHGFVSGKFLRSEVPVTITVPSP